MIWITSGDQLTRSSPIAAKKGAPYVGTLYRLFPYEVEKIEIGVFAEHKSRAPSLTSKTGSDKLNCMMVNEVNSKFNMMTHKRIMERIANLLGNLHVYHKPNSVR